MKKPKKLKEKFSKKEISLYQIFYSRKTTHEDKRKKVKHKPQWVDDS